MIETINHILSEIDKNKTYDTPEDVRGMYT